jgi:hypothetical protein
MGRLARRLLQCRHDHPLHLIHRDRRRPARPILVHQPVQSPGHEAAAPLADRRRMHAQISSDLAVRRPLGTGQHDLGALGSAWDDFARRDQRTSVSRSAAVSHSSAFGRPVLAMSPSLPRRK